MDIDIKIKQCLSPLVVRLEFKWRLKESLVVETVYYINTVKKRTKYKNQTNGYLTFNIIEGMSLIVDR